MKTDTIKLNEDLVHSLNEVARLDDLPLETALHMAVALYLNVRSLNIEDQLKVRDIVYKMEIH